MILDPTNMKDAHAVRRQMLSLALMLALQGFVGSADGVPSSSALNICASSGPGWLRVAMMMQQTRLRRCDCSGCFGTCLSQGAACTQWLQTLQVPRTEAIISLGPLTFRCVPHDNLWKCLRNGLARWWKPQAAPNHAPPCCFAAAELCSS